MTGSDVPIQKGLLTASVSRQWQTPEANWQKIIRHVQTHTQPSWPYF